VPLAGVRGADLTVRGRDADPATVPGAPPRRLLPADGCRGIPRSERPRSSTARRRWAPPDEGPRFQFSIGNVTGDPAVLRVHERPDERWRWFRGQDLAVIERLAQDDSSVSVHQREDDRVLGAQIFGLDMIIEPVVRHVGVDPGDHGDPFVGADRKPDHTITNAPSGGKRERKWRDSRRGGRYTKPFFALQEGVGRRGAATWDTAWINSSFRP